VRRSDGIATGLVFALLAAPLALGAPGPMPCDAATPHANEGYGPLLPGEAFAVVMDRAVATDKFYAQTAALPLDWSFYDADTGALFSYLENHTTYAIFGGTGFPPHVCLAIADVQATPSAFAFRWA
jgi:hypothetical protein